MKYLKKWLSVAHPLLFAMFFILVLYSGNVAEVSPSEIWIPLFAALGFALLMILLSLLLIRLIRKLQNPQKSSQPYQIWDLRKAAIIASIFIVLFFSYGYVYKAILGADIMSIFTHGIMFTIWSILIICSAYFVTKAHRELYKLTAFLGILATTLVIISSIHIMVNETKAAWQVEDNIGNNTVDLGKPDTLPDIYYIILDRYASARTLKDVYDFDNSAFLDYLSDRGFYVASESVSNYHCTPVSLLSSLNMDFIHEEAAEGPIIGTLRDYKVWRLLKTAGYEFIHFGSSWEPMRENPYADMNFNYYSMPEFSSLVFQNTWAYPACIKLHIVESLSLTHYKRVVYKFDKLAEIPEIEEPTYVFAHMLVPHLPYVFDRDGNWQTWDEINVKSERDNYIDQLIATNAMVTELIDELLTNSEIRPIIIIQADEGPYPGGYIEFFEGGGFNEATEAELRQKYGILNAYYLPNIDEGVLYPSITPVNSFRLIFNLYFETDFELLPDRSYCPYKDDPFFDISDIVKID